MIWILDIINWGCHVIYHNLGFTQDIMISWNCEVKNTSLKSSVFWVGNSLIRSSNWSWITFHWRSRWMSHFFFCLRERETWWMSLSTQEMGEDNSLTWMTAYAYKWEAEIFIHKLLISVRNVEWLLCRHTICMMKREQ